MVVMAPMQATTIRASMTAYSTAVGPSSRFTKSTADDAGPDTMTGPSLLVRKCQGTTYEWLSRSPIRCDQASLASVPQPVRSQRPRHEMPLATPCRHPQQLDYTAKAKGCAPPWTGDR